MRPIRPQETHLRTKEARGEILEDHHFDVFRQRAEDTAHPEVVALLLRVCE